MVDHYGIRTIAIIGLHSKPKTLWNFEVNNEESLEENFFQRVPQQCIEKRPISCFSLSYTLLIYTYFIGRNLPKKWGDLF